MRDHLFGAFCSPHCVNYALQRAAEDNKNKFNATVVDAMKSNFYVDDCLKSVTTEKQIVKLVKDFSDLCAKEGFKMAKLVSNSCAVLSAIPDATQS